MQNVDYSSLTKVSCVLTNERLSKALTEWFEEEYTFTHWEYVSDTGKGDSYLSEVIRIKIWGKNKIGKSNHVQVILKNIPQNLSRRKTFRSDEFFQTEINFYTKILPKLLDFQASKNVNEPFKNYVKLFFSYCDGEHDVICLEDASLENYETAYRQKGRDIDHCKVTIKALAKYNALSFAFKDQHPKEFEDLGNLLIERYYSDDVWGWYEKFWARLCNIAIDAVENEYPNSTYSNKIRKFATPEIYKACSKACAETRKTGVIGHGDTWTNNFLYKYVDGRVVDCKLIDFQQSRYATPVLDLSFFIFSCTTQKLRDQYYDGLLKYYHDELSQHIKELGSDPNKVYSWEVFQEEVKKYSFFGLAFSFQSVPVIVLPPEEAMDMDMEGDEKRNINDIWQVPLLKTKENRLREAENFKFCVDRGYIYANVY